MVDANGQSLAYIYSRETTDTAHMAKMLTEDEARRIAGNIAKAAKLARQRESGVAAINGEVIVQDGSWRFLISRRFH